MYLYNITVVMDDEIHEAARERIMTPLANHRSGGGAVSFLQLLDSPHQGTTYCIQLRTESESDIAIFQQQCLQTIQTLAEGEFSGKLVLFDSTMKYLTIP